MRCRARDFAYRSLNGRGLAAVWTGRDNRGLLESLRFRWRARLGLTEVHSAMRTLRRRGELITPEDRMTG
jgi:hypothetical protein